MKTSSAFFKYLHLSHRSIYQCLRRTTTFVHFHLINYIASSSLLPENKIERRTVMTKACIVSFMTLCVCERRSLRMLRRMDFKKEKIEQVTKLRSLFACQGLTKTVQNTVKQRATLHESVHSVCPVIAFQTFFVKCILVKTAISTSQ